jgi:sortase (surface protein transpeptidase)
VKTGGSIKKRISILKQTKRKHQLTIKTCTKYVDKKSRYETKSPAKNLQISRFHRVGENRR